MNHRRRENMMVQVVDEESSEDKKKRLIHELWHMAIPTIQRMLDAQGGKL